LIFVRNGDLLVMNPDGSGQTNLTNSASIETWPTWSPDGRRIAFASNRDDRFGTSLYVMNSDGTNPVRITTPAPAQDLTPAWSPDGTRIAFVRSQAEGSAPPVGDIYLINPDGTGLTNLTNNPAEYSAPDWSPDGRRIAFSGNLPGHEAESSEIFMINADGSGLIDLSNNPAYDFEPTWSADGRKIAFTSGRITTPYNYDIFEMNADGSHQRSLTQGSLADDFNPDWSPR
jgi:Tol biopolymer transport system component